MLTNHLIEFQQADINDIESLIDIEIESHQHTDKSTVLDDALNALLLQEYKKRWLQKLQNGIVTIMIFFNHLPAGFISFSILENIGEIHNIYVISSLRRRGLGKQLISTAVKQILQHPVTKIMAWLVEGRRAIVRFYKKIGFTETSQTRIDRISANFILIEMKYGMMVS